MNNLILRIVAIFVLFGLISCKKVEPQPLTEELNTPVLPETPYDYVSKHNVNSAAATLGRVLFFDKKLSANNFVSCGSCHKQEFAFADNVQFSKGFNGIELNRNSPSIQGIRGFSVDLSSSLPNENNQVNSTLFWDGRQKNVADMVLNPVLNHKEMDMGDFNTLIEKLQKTSYYPELFKKAFGSEKITKQNMAYALQSFIACLNTKTTSITFNQNSGGGFNPSSGFSNNPNDSLLTPLEKTGKSLFHNKYNCAKCHDPITQQPSSYGAPPISNQSPPALMFNIGLDEVTVDKGLGALTGRAGDDGLFKVPTLKNISLTAPYMHDGRFNNLSEVLDHYSHGIKANPNVAPLFKDVNGNLKPLNISNVEKTAIIAFLNTLKDNDFLTSPMYSNPFVEK
jgi:cytochrome c peroxidase